MVEPGTETEDRSVNQRLKSKEFLYSRVEQKIGLAKLLWQTAQSLPIQSPDDLENAGQTDRQKLDEVLMQADSNFPHAASLKPHYYELIASMESRKKELWVEQESQYRDPVFQDLQKEHDRLLANADVRFLVVLENGTQAALDKRERMRSIFRQLGPDWKTPQAYANLSPDPRFANSIAYIVPASFSICLFIYPLTFDRYKEGQRVVGFHQRGTIWNLIRYEGRLVRGNILSYPSNQILDSRHEDFHSFFEGFSLSKPYDNRNAFFVATDELRRLNQKANTSPAEKKGLVQNIQRLLLERAEEYKGELLAEYASLPGHGQQYPDWGSFYKRTTELFEWLRGFKTTADPSLTAFITRIESSLRAPLREIRPLYENVQAQAPERIEDLDIAFAVFPLAKMRHIKRLVRRWTASTALRNQSV